MNGNYKTLCRAAFVALACAASCGCASRSGVIAEIEDAAAARAEVLACAPAKRAKPADAAGLPAPETVSGPLSLEECLVLAFENNPGLRAQMQTETEMRAELTAAEAAAYPRLSLGAEASKTGQSTGGGDAASLALSATQPLYRGGAVRAGMRAAAFALLQAEMQTASVSNELRRSVTVAYCDWLLSRELVAVQRGASDTADRLLSSARSRRERGAATEYEVLRAQVEVANSGAALLDARNAESLARIALLDMIGVSQGSAVEPVGTLDDSDGFAAPEDAARTALEERPEIAAAHAALRIAEENLAAKRADFKPSVDLFGRGTYENRGTDESSDWEDEWTVGLSASYTLFDGFERSGRIRAAEAAVERAKENLRSVEQSVMTEVSTAEMNLAYALEYRESQKRNLETARELSRMVEAGLKAGRNTQIEALDARDAVTAALGSYHRAAHSVRTAAAELRKSTGK